jgi:hypothetical protein
MIIKIRNNRVADLPYLLRLVLKHIYEPSNMSTAEEELMQSSFINWNSKLVLRDGEKEILEKLAWGIKKNQEGFFNERKLKFKEFGIDYKKFHRLAESMVVTPERQAELIKILATEKNKDYGQNDKE